MITPVSEPGPPSGWTGHGYRSMRALNPNRLFRILEREEVAAIVLAPGLRATNPLRLIRRVRQQAAARDVPVLYPFATGHDPIRTRHLAELPGVEVIPCDTDCDVLLRTRIAACVEAHRKTRRCIQTAASLLDSEADLGFLVHQLRCAILRLELEVTERDRAREALRQEQQRLRSLLQRTGHWVWEVDRDGRLTYTDENLDSLPREAWPVVDGDSGAQARRPAPVAERLRELLGGPPPGPDQVIEVEHHTDSRRPVPAAYITSIVPVWEERHGWSGFRGVVTDITRRKRAEAGSVQAEKMRAVALMAAGVVHDCNNILMVVRGNLELLAEEVAANPEASEFIDDTRAAALQAAELMDRLANISGNRPYRREALSLRTFLAKNLDLFKRAAGPECKLDLQEPRLPLRVTADPNALLGAVLSLLENARDATPDGGRIDLRIESELPPPAEASGTLAAGRYIRLDVSDQGHGMEPQVAARCIEPFFTTKVGGNGTGLGLSVADGFTRHSGGALRIETAPGRGTTVSLLLPEAT